ncbi:MAG TPA: hypothetical protein VGG46_15470 [Terriglobales bacterium]|jgi:hypothetical protein
MDLLSALVILTACAYYFFAWALAGRNQIKRAMMPIYTPPRDLSPALLRYVWMERYDDRAFWASVLSLVSKGLACLDSCPTGPVLKPEKSAENHCVLPPEEALLLNRLLGHHKRQGMTISMLDDESAFLVGEMAHCLRKMAVGKWFSDNRGYLWGGGAISLVAVCILAHPNSLQQWVAFAVSLGVMAPGAFYLAFLLFRMKDLLHALSEKLSWAALRRTAGMVWLALPCAAGIVVGCVIIGANFGWLVLAATAFLSILNLAFMHLFRTPTADGKRLLDEIHGFRLFLHSVERYPMDRSDAPRNQSGLYEKYLPYAVALEVEQQWADKYVALASTAHQNEKMMTAHSFYLGMWDGKPVEITLAPQPATKYY